MKHTILTLALLSSGAMSADYDNAEADYSRLQRDNDRVLNAEPEPYRRTFEEPIVNVPIPPSTTGPSYYGPNTVYTQEQNCFKDSMTGTMRCYPR